MFLKKKRQPKSESRAAPQQKSAKSEREPFMSRTKIMVLLILSLIVTLYTIASIYTPWTGTFGEKVSACLLEFFGGAVIIPLTFAVYLLISKITGKKIISPYRQTIGTALIFITAALLLGLYLITDRSGRAHMPFLAAGILGKSLAVTIFSEIGAIGTFFFGSLMLYLALAFYKIQLVMPQFMLKFAAFIAIVLSGTDKKDESKTRRSSQEAYVATAELPAEEDSCPNITECEDKNYFTNEEDKIDISSVPENISQTEAESSNPHEPEAMHQDPSFVLEEDNDSHVRQGIFPPPIEIFVREESHDGEITEEKARPLGEKIIKALEQFSIESRLAEILVGPTVIQFRIQLAPGIKVSKVASLANDIALAMAVPSLRIEAPIPGKPYVGIEIPNPKRRGIPLRTVVEDDAFQYSGLALPLPFGVAVNGDSVVVGMEELPHLLVAGTTGSGKSVFVNACIVGLCSMKTPSELRMILVDPKRVEMAIYDKLPHLLTPPVTDPKKAIHVLAWAIREMEQRYTTFAKARVRNLEGFNEKVIPKDRLPHIVIVVDELADLMMTAAKEVEEYICRLAQMARATGIHLMLATQRPSVNVITGLIKANIPARVAFTLPSNADSRTIIDCAGAEKLLGKGDMLFLSTKHPKPIRIQSPWVGEDVLSEWLKYLGNIFGAPDFIEIDNQGSQQGGFESSAFDDDMLEDAIDSVMSTGIASASGLQRRLRVGFSRASRLIDMMEQLGIVGSADGSRPREILVDEDGAQQLLENAKNH